MSINFNISNPGDYLLVEASGIADNFTTYFDKFVTKVIEHAIRKECKRLLIDERQLVFNLTDQDLALVCKCIDDFDLSARGIRHAVLFSGDNFKPCKCFSADAEKKSIEFKYFFDREPALKWLLQDAG